MMKKLLCAALMMGAAFTSNAQGRWSRDFDRGPMGPPPGGPGMDEGQGPQQFRGGPWQQGPQMQDRRGAMREMMRERFGGGQMGGMERGPQAWGRGGGRGQQMGPQQFRGGPWQRGPQMQDRRGAMREMMRERFGGGRMGGMERGPQAWGRGGERGQQMGPQQFRGGPWQRGPQMQDRHDAMRGMMRERFGGGPMGGMERGPQAWGRGGERGQQMGPQQFRGGPWQRGQGQGPEGRGPRSEKRMKQQQCPQGECPQGGDQQAPRVQRQQGPRGQGPDAAPQMQRGPRGNSGGPDTMAPPWMQRGPQGQEPRNVQRGPPQDRQEKREGAPAERRERRQRSDNDDNDRDDNRQGPPQRQGPPTGV